MNSQVQSYRVTPGAGKKLASEKRKKSMRFVTAVFTENGQVQSYRVPPGPGKKLVSEKRKKSCTPLPWSSYRTAKSRVIV
ncbi:unnamed protein product, partial [Iphiclides podalirius]